MKGKGFSFISSSRRHLSSEELSALVKQDLTKLSVGEKELGKVAEDNALRKSFRIAEELESLGFEARVVNDARDLRGVESAFQEGVAGDLSYSQFLQAPGYLKVPAEDQLFLQAAWLYRNGIPGMQYLEAGAALKQYHSLIVKTTRDRIPFIVTSLDEDGKACGFAACVYLKKSNILLVKDIVVEEAKKELGVDSLLISKAIDIANLRAMESGQAGVAAVAAEVEMPSSQASYSQNKVRLEKMGYFVNNGLFPVSGLDYLKSQESFVEAALKAERLIEEAAELEEEREIGETLAKSKSYMQGRVPLLLFIRPVNTLKKITPRKLKKAIKEIHEELEEDEEVEELVGKLKGMAVLRIRLLDVKKIFALGKILGMKVPGDEGDGDDDD